MTTVNSKLMPRKLKTSEHNFCAFSSRAWKMKMYQLLQTRDKNFKSSKRMRKKREIHLRFKLTIQGINIERIS